MSTLLIIIILVVAVAVIAALHEQSKVDAMTPANRSAYLKQQEDARLTLVHGPVNAAMVCPHCQARSRIRTKAMDRKKGISGGKATAALLTGGVSMLATGLSRKEHVTRAFCENCKNAWDF